MARTLEQLDEAVLNLESQIASLNITVLRNRLDALTARVNILDGTNLPPSQKSTIRQLANEINGLRTTLNQSVLAMEGTLMDVKERYKALLAQLQNLGIA